MKEVTYAGSGCKWYEGVADKIDKDGLTMVVITEDKEVKEYHLAPIDLLLKGEMLPDATGSCAYRWKDIKRG